LRLNKPIPQHEERFPRQQVNQMIEKFRKEYVKRRALMEELERVWMVETPLTSIATIRIFIFY